MVGSPIAAKIRDEALGPLDPAGTRRAWAVPPVPTRCYLNETCMVFLRIAATGNVCFILTLW